MSTSTILIQAENFARTHAAPEKFIYWGKLDQNGLRRVHVSFPIVNYHPFYRWDYPYCPPRCPQAGSSSTRQSDDSQLALLMAISSFFTLAISYFLGEAVGEIYQTNRKINELETVEISDPKMQKVAQLHKEILKDMNSSVKTGLALKGALAASAAVAVGGAIAISPVTTAIGLAGTAASTAALLVRRGHNDHDLTTREKAEDLLEAVNLAKT
jgi:hypothetical protein